MISSENKIYGKNFHDFRYAYMYGKSRKFIQSRTQNILFDLTYVTQNYFFTKDFSNGVTFHLNIHYSIKPT